MAIQFNAPFIQPRPIPQRRQGSGIADVINTVAQVYLGNKGLGLQSKLLDSELARQQMALDKEDRKESMMRDATNLALGMPPTEGSYIADLFPGQSAAQQPGAQQPAAQQPKTAANVGGVADVLSPPPAPSPLVAAEQQRQSVFGKMEPAERVAASIALAQGDPTALAGIVGADPVEKSLGKQAKASTALQAHVGPLSDAVSSFRGSWWRDQGGADAVADAAMQTANRLRASKVPEDQIKMAIQSYLDDELGLGKASTYLSGDADDIAKKNMVINTVMDRLGR